MVGGLVSLLLLVAYTRVGVLIHYKDTLSITFKIGWFRIRLKDKPKQQQTENSKKKKAKSKKGTDKEKKKPNWDMIKDGVTTLAPYGWRMLKKTTKSIRIDPLILHYTFGGADDPATTAKRYGQVHGLVWTVMPKLEKILDIRNPSIGLDLDFEASQSTVFASCAMTARIGTLVSIPFGLVVPAIRWYMRYQNVQKSKTTTGSTSTT